MRPLAEALRAMGIRVWYDEFELRLGDNLRRSIDRGLADCSFGLVVLSPRFFGKKWTNRELDGLVAKEMAEDRVVILPIWLDTSFEEVAGFSPPLANTLSLKYNGDMTALVSSIAQRFRADEPYLQLSGEHRVILDSRDGSSARWHIRRTVQVGPNELKQMELRVSTDGSITPAEFSPGRFVGYENIGGVRMAIVHFNPAMQPGEVFTQEWVFDTENMYSKDKNAAIVAPRVPYERYTLSVHTKFPGSIGEVRAYKRIGLKEISLGPVMRSPKDDWFKVELTNPEVGVTHLLQWSRM